MIEPVTQKLASTQLTTEQGGSHQAGAPQKPFAFMGLPDDIKAAVVERLPSARDVKALLSTNKELFSKRSDGSLFPTEQPFAGEIRKREHAEQRVLMQQFLHRLRPNTHLATFAALSKLAHLLPTFDEAFSGEASKALKQGSYITGRGLERNNFQRKILPLLTPNVQRAAIEDAHRADTYQTYLNVSSLGKVAPMFSDDEWAAHAERFINHQDAGWTGYLATSLSQLHRGLNSTEAERSPDRMALRSALIERSFALPDSGREADENQRTLSIFALAPFWKHLSADQQKAVVDAGSARLRHLQTVEPHYDNSLNTAHLRSHSIALDESCEAFGALLPQLSEGRRELLLAQIHALPDKRMIEAVDALGPAFRAHFPQLEQEARRRRSLQAQPSVPWEPSTNHDAFEWHMGERATDAQRKAAYTGRADQLVTRAGVESLPQQQAVRDLPEDCSLREWEQGKASLAQHLAELGDEAPAFTSGMVDKMADHYENIKNLGMFPIQVQQAVVERFAATGRLQRIEYVHLLAPAVIESICAHSLALAREGRYASMPYLSSAMSHLSKEDQRLIRTADHEKFKRDDWFQHGLAKTFADALPFIPKRIANAPETWFNEIDRLALEPQ